ncbi:hypothetical protein M413DRAFT_240404 [Hebeloma cylindrosporum]|uniref:Uncharacterized protein n=1 Tax=Hebeloma cylindrosporum TaxID=76867 RepID=A0A0C3BPY5_HEBCY|nr:hypothetical protein M413DRAFT_240404 [Hebeloma cylindrosporum h7]
MESNLERSKQEMKVLKKSLEDAGRENRSLRQTVDEFRDRKTGVKKEPSDFVTLRATSEKSVLTDATWEVDTLQGSLETYRAKYKQEKQSKKEWKRSFQESEKRASEVEAQNEELVRKSKSREPSVNRANKTLLTVAKPPRRQELNDFMLSLPKYSKRPPINDIGPIAVKDVDLPSLLTLDPIFSPLLKNFLYLPGRVMWCDSDYHHAVGLGPQHIFDEEKDTWVNKSIFTGVYEKTLTLFYLWQGHIYYGGLYKVVNMRSWNPDGCSFRSKSVSSWALADVTIQGRVNLSTTPRPVRDVIAKMYQDEVLNVEYLGLQCVGFDRKVYNSLRSFFEVSERMQAVKRASVVRPPEAPRGVKRQRIH